MTHWGWYWKIKQQHTPKSLCSRFSFSAINSFDMFKNKERVALVRNSDDRVSLEIPRYNLKAVLMPNDSLSVTYNDGSYVIPVEKKPCNYGGFYYFFHCPQCDARMRKLYCSNGKYLCRKCLKLGYYSQRLRPSKRAFVQSIKVKDKLTNRSGSLFKRPVRMKARTFKKLRQRYLKYDKQYHDETGNELRAWYGARVEPHIDGYYSPPFSP
jgi:hypothetical protein